MWQWADVFCDAHLLALCVILFFFLSACENSGDGGQSYQLCCAADFYMSLYNVVFTALTPLMVGTMDSDVNREMSRKYPGTLSQSAFQHMYCAPVHMPQYSWCTLCQHT